MHTGYYESLVNRVSTVVERRVVFFISLFDFSIDCDFEGSHHYVYVMSRDLEMCEVNPTGNCEPLYRKILERYFVEDGNPRFRLDYWIDEAHLGYLRSKSFRELDIKLSLIGV